MDRINHLIFILNFVFLICLNLKVESFNYLSEWNATNEINLFPLASNSSIKISTICDDKLQKEQSFHSMKLRNGSFWKLYEDYRCCYKLEYLNYVINRAKHECTNEELIQYKFERLQQQEDELLLNNDIHGKKFESCRKTFCPVGHISIECWLEIFEKKYEICNIKDDKHSIICCNLWYTIDCVKKEANVSDCSEKELDYYIEFEKQQRYKSGHCQSDNRKLFYSDINYPNYDMRSECNWRQPLWAIFIVFGFVALIALGIAIYARTYSSCSVAKEEQIGYV